MNKISRLLTGAKIWNSIPSNVRKSSFRNFKSSKHIFFTHLISRFVYRFVVLHSVNQVYIYSTAFIYCNVEDANCVAILVALAYGGNVVTLNTG